MPHKSLTVRESNAVFEQKNGLEPKWQGGHRRCRDGCVDGSILKKAFKDAEEMPLVGRSRKGKGFIEKARKRIVKERATEMLRLDETELKLEELRALHKKQAVPPPVQPHTDAGGEVARNGVRIATAVAQGLPVAKIVSPFRIREREGFVPATEHEVMEWMSDRQEEMNATLVSGNPMEVARISGLITNATKSVQPTPVPSSMVTNTVFIHMCDECKRSKR